MKIAPTVSVQREADPLQDVKALAMDSLQKRYGYDKVGNHAWEWIQRVGAPAEYLPIYAYKKPATLRGYWDEWTVGLDGHLSIRELNEGWDARWRRNKSGLKTDNSRYNKVYDLIDKLRSRDNWTMELVWRFLDDRFPIPTQGVRHLATTRSFIDYLQRKDGLGMNDVLSAANTYP